jgi:hypothetical protein
MEAFRPSIIVPVDMANITEEFGLHKFCSQNVILAKTLSGAEDEASSVF